MPTPAGMLVKVALRRVPKPAKPAVPPETGTMNPDSAPGVSWDGTFCAKAAAVTVLFRGVPAPLSVDVGWMRVRNAGRKPSRKLRTAPGVSGLAAHCWTLMLE